MHSSGSVRRWFTFSLSASALVVGLAVLTAQATDNGLATLPDGNTETPTQPTVVTNGDDSVVVDRLDTWAETKLKTKISRAKGGGRGK